MAAALIDDGISNGRRSSEPVPAKGVEVGRVEGGEYGEAYVRDLARQAYEGNPSIPLLRGRFALLVIDMQDEFVKPGWTPFWVPEATRIVAGVADLMQKCRALSVPVVFTAFAKTHLYRDRPRSGVVMPNRFPSIAGDPEWFRDGTIWHELEPLDDEVVIHKPSYGAFWDTPLQTILRNFGCDTILICGTLTNYCCGTTARQGYERGFNVVVVGDLTATDDPELQEAELRTLRKGFARVATLEEVSLELSVNGSS
jgi:nicotinamidase-related amidase